MGESSRGRVSGRRRFGLHSLLSRVLVGSVALIVLLVVIIVGVVDAARSHQAATRWADHSAQVLNAAQLTEREVVDLETGVRGYAATGDRLFLAPWYAARRALPPQLSQLERLVADNAAQTARVRVLDSAVHDYITSFMAPFVARPRPLRGMALLSFMIAGKQRLDVMRGQFAVLDAAERRLQTIRNARSHSSDLRFVWLSIAAGLLMVLGLISIIWFVLVRVVLPLRRTVQACEATADGRPGSSLAIGGASELAALGTAFDRMLGQLHARERERQAAADQIAEMLRLQQTVIDSVHHAYIAFDHAGQITAINPAAERTFEITPARAVGRSVLELVGEGERDAWVREMGRFRQTGEGDRLGRLLESTGRRADGSEFPVEATVTVARHHGEPTFHAFISDISERFARQRDLHLMASIVEGSEDAILTEATDGTILSFNRGAELLYGYRAQEVVGRHISLLVGPEREGEDAQLLQRALAGEAITRLETIRVHRDGHRVHVSLTVSPLFGGDDAIIGASIIARDVTERQQMEEELRASREQALEASRLKSEFVANMSHEIRTPLNGVVSMTELLLETPLNGDQRDYAQVALTSAEALMRVINDILDFSKIEAGKLDIVSEDFSLRAAVDETAEILAGKARERGLQLSVEVDDGVAEVIRGDGNRVRQILMNLVSNAIKFTSDGGVTISVGLEPDAAAPRLRFAVADTGIGIDPARIGALFAPFAQEDATTTRRYGGTGLGLCISKQLVELMGGEIGCHSIPGTGSTFHFSLPYLPSDGDDATSASFDLTGTRMLIVAAETDLRRQLEGRLASWGVSPDGVGSGAEALARMRSAAESGRPYQAALISRELAGRDGLSLGGEIRATPALHATRLILTATAPGDPLELRQAGFDAQLITPIRPSRLYNQLLSTLRRARAQAPGAGPAPAAALPAGPAGAGPDQTGSREAGPGEAERITVLVAEDNEVNQFAATRLLQTFGLRVEIARNGREAITMSGRGDYVAVFMDCQMPEMDGFTAARAIRAREQETGGHIPIIALTANALEGDRERCLAAGMDDYVSKPLRLSTIETLVQRIPALAGPARVSGFDPARLPVLDPAPLRELDDPALAAAMARMFLDQETLRVAALQAALEQPDAAQVRELAHGLRGSAATVGAQRMSEMAEQLCRLAAEDRLDGRARELGAALGGVLEQTGAALGLQLPGGAD
jgi:two-component system sensor histidine kinase/response regulator